jgi:hypothetical protein
MIVLCDVRNQNHWRRSKNYVFAMFPAAVGAGTALVYLAGRSESESQRWMHDLVRFLDPNHITGE